MIRPLLLLSVFILAVATLCWLYFAVTITVLEAFGLPTWWSLAFLVFFQIGLWLPLRRSNLLRKRPPGAASHQCNQRNPAQQREDKDANNGGA